MNLRHISLPRGPERLRSRAEVNEKVMALVTPWLGTVVATGKRCPLVLPAVSHFSASAQATDNTLKVDLWGPVGQFRAERPHKGKTALVATLAVAPDPAAGEPLWSSLLQQGGLSWREPPDEPWFGVLPEPTGMAGHPKAGRWIGEFQNSMAFAWLAL
jgi:hypothetical protein